MKMTKKALTAMIAASIAATALPAAAMVSNLTNTLTSSNSANANNAVPQDANIAPQDAETTSQNTVTAHPQAAPETSAQTAASTPAVQAEPSPESMFTTEDVDGGVAITGFKTDDANFTSKVIIPPTIDGKTVVSLKSTSDWKCMTGANKVTSLDTSNCTSLSIEDYAFYVCDSSITSVDLSGCTSIGNSAFCGCSGITSVDLSKCTSIGSFAFQNCSSITGSVDLSKCTSIGSFAFWGCSGISGSVDLSKCTYIGNYAFNGCKGITGAIDLSSCNSIGTSAFYQLPNISSVAFPTDHPYTIGDSAFYQCSGITGSVDLSKCTTIENSAFRDCSGITSITFPTEHSYTIGESAFYQCSGITGSVDLSGCNSIGERTFYQCSGITGSVDLSGCNSIGDQTFYHCSGITSVDLSGCTSIGVSAFSGCTGITGSVDLSNCKSIGDFAFLNCSNITGSVDLSNCTFIGAQAFNNCSGITDVTWSSTEKAIPDSCFYGCTSLKTFNSATDFNLSSITSVGKSAFSGCTGITGSVDLSGCNSIGNNAFKSCTSINSITFPTEHSYTIGESAFNGCKGINDSINLSNCNSIGNSAFSGCSSITNVTWSSTEKAIPDSCFYGCTSLKTFNSVTDINLSGITSIGDSAFSSCSGITGSVDLSSCNSIGSSAFNNCTGITGSVDLSNCTSIGAQAFNNCSGITGSVDLSNCNSIGSSAFYKCTNLIPTISTKTATIGKSAFSSPYVIIQADSESTLLNYCASISSSGNLQGLYDVKKLASIPGVTNMPEGLSYDASDIILDSNATYYLTASSKKGYKLRDYQTEAAYDVTLKSVSNGASDATAIEGNIPLTIQIPESQYDSTLHYLFSVNDTVGSYLTPTETYCFTDTISLPANTSTVALVSEDTAVGAFYIKDVEGGVAITGFNASDENFTPSMVIPKEIDGKTVVSLENTNRLNCMKGADKITSLDTSNCTSISIGNRAFYGCTDITSVNLSGCTSIGNNAFHGCTGITSVNLSNISSVGNSAFYGCTGITSVNLPNISSVGNSAFENCNGIFKVTWSTNITTVIPYNCFKGCTNLKTFNGKNEGECNLSDVTSIGDNAFSGCTNMLPVISTKTTTVGNDAFSDCPYVTIQADDEATLENYCSGIAADNELVGLSSVKKLASIPGVTNIPEGLSYNASDIILDSNATYYLTASRKDDYAIPNYQTEAAYDVTLKSVENGASKATAIAGNIPLAIQIPESQYDSTRDYIFSVGNTPIFSYITPTETYCFTDTVSLPDSTSTVALLSLGTTAVGDLFVRPVEGGVVITGFNIPEGETADITVPPTINDQPVLSLENTNFDPENPSQSSRMIGAEQVASLDLSAVTTLKSIDSYAFRNDIVENPGTSSSVLTSVTFPVGEDVAYTIGDAAFNANNKITAEHLDLSGCTSVGNGAFQACIGVESVDLSHCTSIGDYAFACFEISIAEKKETIPMNLSSITFPTSPDIVYTVGEGAFGGNPKLSSLDLSRCTSIGMGAFAGPIKEEEDQMPNLTEVIFPTDHPYTIDDGAFFGAPNLTKVDLTHCTSIANQAFGACRQLQPTISTNTAVINANAFAGAVEYADDGIMKILVTIQADSEDALANYCTGITKDGDLEGLSKVKKVAKIPGVTDIPTGLSYNVSDIIPDVHNDSDVVPDVGATYYLTASASSDYTLENYQTPAAYDITLKSVKNGASEATAVEGNIPLTIEMPTEQYDPDRNYYFAADDNILGTKLSPAEMTTSFTDTVPLQAKTTHVALVSPNVTSIDIVGENTLTYGASSPTYTATVKPDDAKQAVTWSSSNENVLKFEDENSGTATIVGAGETTITATATDGSGITKTSTITVKKVEPIVTLKDKNTSYTGQPIEIDGAVVNLENDSSPYDGEQPIYTYYSDAECQNKLEEGPPTDAGTYYVKASITDQNNYIAKESDPATLTITQVDVTAVPPAPEMESQTPDSITLKTVDGGTTEQGDAYSTQYGIDIDGEITWQDNATFTGLTPGDHNFYLRYRVNEPKTGNYTNDGYSAPSEAATFIVNQIDPPAVGEGFTIDYVNETITLEASYEAATDANFAAENMLNSGDKIQPGSTVYVRTAATGDAIASVGTPNAIASRPATPTVPNVVQTVNMLTVTNPGDQQEYKFDKAVNATRTSTLGQWQSSPVFTDSNMKAGDTYTVTTRIKATETTFASEEATTGTTTEAFPEKQETLKGDTNEAGEFVWTDSDGNDYTGSYDIPTRLLTTGGDTYMVEIDWGDMLFSYNFGTWDTETLSYNDDPATLRWGTSFDGTNNQVTVINRSSDQVDATLNLALNEDQKTSLDKLGFHLTKGNTNDNANDYPTTAQTLQSGATGNSTTAYVNIGADDLTPHTGYDTKTHFGNITVTVQKTN